MRYYLLSSSPAAPLLAAFLLRADFKEGFFTPLSLRFTSSRYLLCAIDLNESDLKFSAGIEIYLPSNSFASLRATFLTLGGAFRLTRTDWIEVVFLPFKRPITSSRYLLWTIVLNEPALNWVGDLIRWRSQFFVRSVRSICKYGREKNKNLRIDVFVWRLLREKKV